MVMFSEKNSLNVAVTMGDPASIGPEIILKALGDLSLTKYSQITVIGSHFVLKKTYQQLQPIVKENLVNPDHLDIIDLDNVTDFKFGEGNALTGAASFDYLEQAIASTLQGKFQAIVTAPIAKFLWQAAGYNYPGQTEVLAEKSGVERFGMMFIGRSPHTGWVLRTLLATTHIPLSAVATTLNPELMSEKLELLMEFLVNKVGISQPKIAIAGLNPHSGEEGKLGTEEQEWLNLWLNNAQKKYPHVTLMGLIPPDTMWVKPGQAWFVQNKFDTADAYLALYHDQGLIPVKLMAFEQAINTTIGLPFIRTSPDHGTAFDIAGKGIANANSMTEAIKLAIELICT
jgi:4-hydroxythreonine-4-phosphate dehydrogenase